MVNDSGSKWSQHGVYGGDAGLGSRGRFYRLCPNGPLLQVSGGSQKSLPLPQVSRVLCFYIDKTLSVLFVYIPLPTHVFLLGFVELFLFFNYYTLRIPLCTISLASLSLYRSPTH